MAGRLRAPARRRRAGASRGDRCHRPPRRRRLAAARPRRRSTPDSRFSLRWTPDAFGYFRLRARMDADADHDAGVSAAERSSSTGPTRTTCRTVTRTTSSSSGTSTGSTTTSTAPSSAASTWRSDAPATARRSAHFRIYGKRKPAGGALGACAMFYRRQGGIAIHGTNQPYLLRRRVPARLLARLHAHAEPPGAVVVRPRARSARASTTCAERALAPVVPAGWPLPRLVP